MPFPAQERVLFKRNPIIEVVCQLTFSDLELAQAAITLDLMQQYHEKIRHDFPFFDTNKSYNFKIDGAAGTVDTQSNQDVFEFSSVDKQWRLIISPTDIALLTNSYSSWEEFDSRFDTVMKVFSDLFSNSLSYKRVGLRYKNVINKTELGLSEEPWSALLSEDVSPIAMQELSIGNSVKGFQTSLNVKLKDELGMLNAMYSLVQHQVTKDNCIMIDGDFYKEGITSYESARGILTSFNSHARNFFLWSISRKLFTALSS